MSTDEGTTLGVLRREIADFIRERDWEQFHDPKNLSIAIATEAAELMEHFRWVKSDAAREVLKDETARTAISEELADVLAFVLSFANSTGIDLTTALRDKMAKNVRKYPADEFRGRY